MICVYTCLFFVLQCRNVGIFPLSMLKKNHQLIIPLMITHDGNAVGDGGVKR